MKKKRTLIQYLKSISRERILTLPDGKRIDKIIQEYLKMAVDEGVLEILRKFKKIKKVK